MLMCIQCLALTVLDVCLKLGCFQSTSTCGSPTTYLLTYANVIVILFITVADKQQTWESFRSSHVKRPSPCLRYTTVITL